MIQRKRVFEKAEPTKDAQKIYVFCEGDTREKDYFDFFEGMSSNLEIIPIAPYDHKSSPNNLINYAEVLFHGETPTYELDYKQNDKVWFVVDTDQWEEDGLIDLLRNYCIKKNTENLCQAWYVAQSNPSFEIWLYYHIYSTKPLEKEVARYSSFKDFVNSKIAGGFDSRTMPIYIEDAIRNSEVNYDEDENGPSLYSTEVHILGADIVKYSKRELQIKKRTLV
ncbi:MAG: RloB family protein [Bacteroidaceae bacterium]|nr:RloB family protein [Bacteroidaceae bacterium]